MVQYKHRIVKFRKGKKITKVLKLTQIKFYGQVVYNLKFI